jgi:hypothetical protein
MTSEADNLQPGKPQGLYRVHKMRRRDRRGRPWLLWWEDPPDGGATRTRSIGPMSDRLAEDHRILWQAELNGLSGRGSQLSERRRRPS